MTTLWKFRVYDDVTKKRITTRYHLTEEEALKRYGPDAEKVEESRFEPKSVGSTGHFSQGPR